MLSIHLAAVYLQVTVEIGGVVNSVEREVPIDVAGKVDGAVLKQDLA